MTLYFCANRVNDADLFSGQFLDRTASPAFADAEPTAIAIDRSGGSNDGTVYVTAGAGTGAKALAFGPLTAPKREALLEPLSHELEGARSVATDSHGNVYAGTGGEIHIYGPNGSEIIVIENPEDTHESIAVDQSNGHVIEYDGVSGTVHEYDAAGNFITEFGSFTKGLAVNYRVAVDSSCATHEPPLDETTSPTCKEYDSSDGNVYVAFDDTSPKHPPFDVSAFGRLDYGSLPPGPPARLNSKKAPK